MSKSSGLNVPDAATLALDRRKFLSLAPSVALTPSVPAMDVPRAGSASAHPSSIGRA